MHQHIINASIQLVPLVRDKHPYTWIDEVIAIIKESDIKHEVGAFATTLEGTYDEIFKVVHSINDYLATNKCTEWILNVQVQIRSNEDITIEEKVQKFR